MDDFELDFDDVDFLPGIDLYLWLRLVIGTLAVGLCAAVILAL